MFDYALLDRPMFFYTYDLERYRDELRGWYFDFEKEAPGPLSKDTEGLIKDIKALSENGPATLRCSYTSWVAGKEKSLQGKIRGI